MFEYVDDPNGTRSCTMRWDHQFEKAIMIDGQIVCEACYTGAETQAIPIPKPGEPMPIGPSQ